VPLFERDKRATRLTPAGAALLDDARALLGAADAARRRAQDIAAGQRAFTVGFMPGLIVTAAVRELSRRHPDLAVEVLRTDWTNQADVIRDGTVDVGYLRLPADQRGLEVEPLFTEPRVAVVPADHRLAGKDFAFARELGLPISIHAGMAGTGDAVTALERGGLLGADVNYTHGNFLTDAEWDLLADSGGTLTITPSTDMLMQFGTFPPSAAPAPTCSPRCAWPWPPNDPGPTPPPSPATRWSRRWTCTSGTCCAWPPSTAPGSGTWTARSAPSPRASKPTSRSSTCAPRTWTASATRWPSWSSARDPPTWKP
jgi:DNA-binding transcriptional LysR family regulator